jgi:hypothetical protein
VPEGPSAGGAGFTLLEIAAVLLLLGTAFAFISPSLRDYGDREAARVAREVVVGMISFARAEAVATGGATLVLSPRSDSVWVEVDGRIVRWADLRGELSVDLEPGGDSPLRLRFGPLGLGRFASRTITVRRREATRSLSLSSYGRVMRR